MEGLLVGVVSFGAKGCMEAVNFPVVFTKVASHMQWIDSVIREHSAESPIFEPSPDPVPDYDRSKNRLIQPLINLFKFLFS